MRDILAIYSSSKILMLGFIEVTLHFDKNWIILIFVENEFSFQGTQ